MKFETVWANTAHENSVLRLTSVLLLAVSICLSIAVTKLALREPVVLERSCETAVRTSVPTSQTEEEVKAFLLAALPMRFDSVSNINSVWMSEEQVAQKNKDIEELSKKGISQRLLLEKIAIAPNGAVVSGDRILSVGKVRSLLPFSVHVTLEKTTRSAVNPYGLVFTGFKTHNTDKTQEKESK